MIHSSCAGLVDDKLLSLLTFWSKCVVDWLSGLSCNCASSFSNGYIHLVFKCPIVHLMLTSGLRKEGISYSDFSLAQVLNMFRQSSVRCDRIYTYTLKFMMPNTVIYRSLKRLVSQTFI